MIDATHSRSAPALLLRLDGAPTGADLSGLPPAALVVIGHRGEVPAALRARAGHVFIALEPAAASVQWAQLAAAAPAGCFLLLEAGERLLGEVTAGPAPGRLRVVRPEGVWEEVRRVVLGAGRLGFAPAPAGEVRPECPDAVALADAVLDAPAAPEGPPPASLPSHPVAMAVAGVALARSGEHATAREVLLRAVALLTESTEPWVQRSLIDAACLLLELVGATGEDAERALAQVLPLLERCRDCPELWFAVALVMRAVGNLDDAEVCLDSAARLLPTAPDEWRMPNRLRRSPFWLFEAQAELSMARGQRARGAASALAAVRARPAGESATVPVLLAAFSAASASRDWRDEALVIARIAQLAESEPAAFEAVHARLRALRTVDSARALFCGDVFAAASPRARFDPMFLRIRPTLVPVVPASGSVERPPDAVHPADTVHPADAVRPADAASAGHVTAVSAGPVESTPGRRLRVLVGTENIAGYVEHLAGGLRALGHEVETVLSSDNRFYASFRPDHVTRDLMKDGRVTVTREGDLRLSLPSEVESWLTGFDVAIMVAAQSFAPAGLDLPLLAAAGVKIVSWLPGSESRHWSAAGPMWAALGSRLPEAVADRGLRNASTRLADVALQGVYHNTLANKLLNIRNAERWSQAVFSVPECVGHGVRPYFSIPAPLDPKRFRPDIPGREVPVVVHAPSHRGFKRTGELLAVLDRLRAEGVKFELRLLEGLPHEVIVEELAAADVVLDQMSLYPAILAHEGMASGCAVLTGNIASALPSPHPKPVIHIDPRNVLAETRRLLTDRALRIECARAGRRYIELYCARELVAAQVLAALSPDAEPDLYPSFFFEHASLPVGEVLPAAIRRLTWEVLQTHGAPADADLSRLVAQGFLDAGLSRAQLASVPRWSRPIRELGPWIRARADLWGVDP